MKSPRSKSSGACRARQQGTPAATPTEGHQEVRFPESASGKQPVIPREITLLRAQSRFFLCARGGTELLLLCDSDTSKDQVFHMAWGPGLAALWTQRGGSVLHGSCVRRGSDAFSFVGPSGRGKSTLAAGLRERGYDFVSDGMTLAATADTFSPQASGPLRVARAALPEDASFPENLEECFGWPREELPELARSLEEHLTRATSLEPSGLSLALREEDGSARSEPSPFFEGYSAHPGPSWFKLDDASLKVLGREPDALPFVHPRVNKRLLTLDAEPRALHSPARLRQLFVLEEGDALAFAPLRGPDKLSAVLDNMYLRDFTPGIEPRLFRSAAALARRIPVARLKRPRGFERMNEVLDFVERQIDATSR